MQGAGMIRRSRARRAGAAVIPAKAGIQFLHFVIPAKAGIHWLLPFLVSVFPSS